MSFSHCLCAFVVLIASADAFGQDVTLPCRRLNITGDTQGAYCYSEAVVPGVGSDYDTPGTDADVRLAIQTSSGVVAGADIDARSEVLSEAYCNAAVNQEVYAPYVNGLGSAEAWVQATNASRSGTAKAESGTTARGTFEIRPHPAVGTQGLFGANVTVEGALYLTCYGSTTGPGHPLNWLGGDFLIECDVQGNRTFLEGENPNNAAGWTITGEIQTSSRENPNSDPVEVEDYLTDELNDFYEFSSVALQFDDISLLSDVSIISHSQRNAYGSNGDVDWSYSMLVYCSVIDEQI